MPTDDPAHKSYCSMHFQFIPFSYTDQWSSDNVVHLRQRQIWDRQLGDVTPIYELPTQWTANPNTQENFRKLNNFPSFEQVDHTGKFYNLIANNFQVFPTWDQAAKIKDKMTINDYIVAIHTSLKLFKVNNTMWHHHDFGTSTPELCKVKTMTDFLSRLTAKMTTRYFTTSRNNKEGNRKREVCVQLWQMKETLSQLSIDSIEFQDPTSTCDIGGSYSPNVAH